MGVKNFVRGEGPQVFPGYFRGDSWSESDGTHADCSEKVVVVGAGLGLHSKGTMVPGVLVRCLGCLRSWVIC